MSKSKQEYHEERINEMLQQELNDLKKLTLDIESIINADLLDINLKAIKVFEEMQKVKFNSYIFREIEEMTN